MNKTASDTSELSNALDEIAVKLEEIGNRVKSIADEESAEYFLPIDGVLCGTFHALDACLRYAVLHSPASLKPFSPRKPLQTYNASMINRSENEINDVLGDARMVTMALQAIRENIDIEVGGGIQIRLYGGESPWYQLTLSEGSALQSPLAVGKKLTIDGDRLHALWAAATGGGYIEVHCSGLELHLTGEGDDTAYGDLRMQETTKILAPAVLALKSWRTTSGAYEGPFATTPEAKRLYGASINIAQSSAVRAQACLSQPAA